MDPVTLVGIVEGSISLAVQCGSVAKSLNNLAGQYKYAKLTISTMVQNLDIMQVAWDRIGAWSKTSMAPIDDHDLMQRLERFLQTGSLVLDALEEDLLSYDASYMTIAQRSRLVWNENILQGHQSRIRDQAQSMSLLLQAIHLPTLEATANLLQQSKPQFMKSDESAFSIVPSRMSSRLSLSTGRTSPRGSTHTFTSMTYHPLSFDNDLFTARVYKRNYRSPQLQRQRREESDRSHEIIVPERQRRKRTTESLRLKLYLSSKEKASTTTSERYAEEHPIFLIPNNMIMVSVTVSVSYVGKTDKDLEHRVGPSMVGREGKVAESFQHCITLASGPYMELVMACARGDNDALKRQLAMIPPSNPQNRDILDFLGSHSLSSCPINAAVSNGHVEVMRTLLKRAKSENYLGWVVEKAIDGTETDRWRPLHVATLKGNLPMVKLLLENGASTLSETGHGIQAAHLAAKAHSKNILLALINEGASLSSKNLYGLTPYDYISESNLEADWRIWEAISRGFDWFQSTLYDWTYKNASLLYENDSILDGNDSKDEKAPWVAGGSLMTRA